MATIRTNATLSVQRPPMFATMRANFESNCRFAVPFSASREVVTRVAIGHD